MFGYIIQFDIFQVFYPTNGGAFVLLLAEPGDDIKPEDFVAFYFDGTCGAQIKAGRSYGKDDLYEIRLMPLHKLFI